MAPQSLPGGAPDCMAYLWRALASATVSSHLTPDVLTALEWWREEISSPQPKQSLHHLVPIQTPQKCHAPMELLCSIAKDSVRGLNLSAHCCRARARVSSCLMVLKSLILGGWCGAGILWDIIWSDEVGHPTNLMPHVGPGAAWRPQSATRKRARLQVHWGQMLHRTGGGL